MDALVNALVDARFPYLHTFETIAKLPTPPGRTNPFLPDANKHLADAAAYRAHLTTRPVGELQQMYEQHVADRNRAAAEYQAARKAKAEKKVAEEAARLFYNRPEATPDYGFWTKLEYWSFEESIGLLLGKNPDVVKHKAVKRTLDPWLLMADPPKPTAFVQSYLTLWAIAERANAMTHSPRLRPSEVVAWAIQSGAVEPPPELVALLPAPAASCNGNGTGIGKGAGDGRSTRTGAGTGTDAVSGPGTAEASEGVATGVARSSVNESPRGTGEYWTDEKRAELRAFKEAHGTKAAAEKYGISEERVRQVLRKDKPPKRVAAHNPFGQRSR